MATLVVKLVLAGWAVSTTVPPATTTQGPSRTQSNPRAAAADTCFWVAFEDDRQSDHWADAYAARVSPAGVLLDPAGIVLQDGPDDQTRPTIGCSGDLCLASWSNFPAANVAQLLASDGTKVGPFIFLDGTALYGPRAISADDAGFVVLQSGSKVEAQRVGRDGTAQPAVILSSGFVQLQSAGAAFNGTRHMLVWATTANDAVYFAWVAPDGTPIDAGQLATVAVNVDVGTDGDGWLVAWDSSTTFSPVQAVRFDSSGAQLDAVPIQLGGAALGEAPTIVFVDGGYGVAFAGSDGVVYVAAVSPDAGYQSTQQAQQAVNGRQLTLASGAPGVALAWQDTNAHVAYATGTDSGFITRGGNGHEDPFVAASGSGFLALWLSDSDPYVHGTALDVDGSVVHAFQIAEGSDALHVPSVAWDGARFLATWLDGQLGELHGSWISPDGTTHSAPFTLISGGFFSHVGAAAGAGTLMTAWTNYVSGPGSRVYALPFQNGVQHGNPIMLSASVPDETAVGVAFAGGAFLIAWSDGLGDLQWCRVAADGTLLSPVVTFDAQTVYPYPQGVSLATDGTGFLATWFAQDPSRGYSFRADALHLDADGGPLGTVTTLVADSTGPQQVADYALPSAVWDGREYVIGLELLSMTTASGIWLVRSLDDGGFGAPEVLVDSPYSEESERLAASSPGRIAAVDLEYEPPPGADNLRVRFHIAADVPLGGYCADGSECHGVPCIGNVCGGPQPDSGMGGGAGGGGAASAGGGGGSGTPSLGVQCGCAGGGPWLAVLLSVLALRRRR
jgi:hypothetical protein